MNEFERAGTCLQFAPDGVARAVKFLGADFKDKLQYFIRWDGGAANTAGTVIP